MVRKYFLPGSLLNFWLRVAPWRGSDEEFPFVAVHRFQVDRGGSVTVFEVRRWSACGADTKVVNATDLGGKISQGYQTPAGQKR